MMKAEVSLGYPKPLAFKYLAAGGGIVPALLPQGITNSLVKYILVFTCILAYIELAELVIVSRCVYTSVVLFSVLVALAHSDPT